MARTIILFALLVGLLVTLVVFGIKTSFPSEAKKFIDTIVSPTFQKCQNNACVRVSGVGVDSCSQDSDCALN